MKYIFLILLLTGCSTLLKVQEKGADGVAKAVIAYCATTIEIERAVLREDMNIRLEGLARIEITCF